MNLKDCQENKDTYSSLTSESVRKLAFAAIAVIWIFRSDTPNNQLLPNELIKPLVYIVICLFLDFLQYLVSSLSWWIFFRIKEDMYGPNSKEEFEGNNWLSIPGYVFYFLKICALFFGYYYILSYFALKLCINS